MYKMPKKTSSAKPTPMGKPLTPGRPMLDSRPNRDPRFRSTSDSGMGAPRDKMRRPAISEAIRRRMEAMKSKKGNK